MQASSTQAPARRDQISNRLQRGPIRPPVRQPADPAAPPALPPGLALLPARTGFPYASRAGGRFNYPYAVGLPEDDEPPVTLPDAPSQPHISAATGTAVSVPAAQGAALAQPDRVMIHGEIRPAEVIKHLSHAQLLDVLDQLQGSSLLAIPALMTQLVQRLRRRPVPVSHQFIPATESQEIARKLLPLVFQALRRGSLVLGAEALTILLQRMYWDGMEPAQLEKLARHLLPAMHKLNVRSSLLQKKKSENTFVGLVNSLQKFPPDTRKSLLDAVTCEMKDTDRIPRQAFDRRVINPKATLMELLSRYYRDPDASELLTESFRVSGIKAPKSLNRADVVQGLLAMTLAEKPAHRVLVARSVHQIRDDGLRKEVVDLLARRFHENPDLTSLSICARNDEILAEIKERLLLEHQIPTSTDPLTCTLTHYRSPAPRHAPAVP